MTAHEVLGWVTDRLADPAEVRALAGDWQAASLVEGYAGIAVFYGSLPGYRERAHAHLAAAVRERTDSGRGGLITGDLAIGYAAAVTARTDEDYRGLRASVAGAARKALARLLALATRAGTEVPGQAEALHRLAEFLLAQAGTDEHGPLWPHYLPWPAPARPAWCYGGPGVVRALQLAGLALGAPAWGEQAVRAMRAALARDAWEFHDASLCHGAAGALRITARIARDSGDEVLRAALPGLTERVLAHVDPAAPFGFRYPDAEFRPVANRAGFLEGAAGIALVLATPDRTAPVPWDAALLLA
ncbi:hypothetical protein JOF53_001355 [Crossiella equi]|uniref:Lanthionine synthetase C-like protein n=1 Tax=Crossiella equi TaxID=130796 RepID=A0ABS5A7B1_9PSEU|nr:lanthionine synthetase LanC family protein [Crossiella equi]MBP2472483.1 hypothetical protein [Crossiella equi]